MYNGKVLYLWQRLNSLTQDGECLWTERCICLTRQHDDVVKREVATVLLKINHLIVRNGQYLWHWQTILTKSLINKDEGLILLWMSTYHTNQGLCVKTREFLSSLNAEITTIATCSCKWCNIFRLYTCQCDIKFFDTFHYRYRGNENARINLYGSKCS